MRESGRPAAQVARELGVADNLVYRWMAEERPAAAQGSTIRFMCRALAVSPAGYYAWRDRPKSSRGVVNRALVVNIRAIYQESRHTLAGGLPPIAMHRAVIEYDRTTSRVGGGIVALTHRSRAAISAGAFYDRVQCGGDIRFSSEGRNHWFAWPSGRSGSAAIDARLQYDRC